MQRVFEHVQFFNSSQAIQWLGLCPCEMLVGRDNAALTEPAQSHLPERSFRLSIFSRVYNEKRQSAQNRDRNDQQRPKELSNARKATLAQSKQRNKAEKRINDDEKHFDNHASSPSNRNQEKFGDLAEPTRNFANEERRLKTRNPNTAFRMTYF